MPSATRAAKLVLEPLTPERWADLEAVFGARGCSVARGCWCMFYRKSGAGSGIGVAENNRRELKAMVDAGEVPGFIGYRDGVPVGWISFGPREHFAKLRRSPVMKPVDDLPVWSVVCFVVPAPYRGQGVARALLDGAIEFAARHGATLEAYPVDKPQRTSDDSMWFGAKSMYDDAGFNEVARRKPTRPVVRLRPA
jgi:GNAT superfamily N-acetyltransferase